MSRRISIVPLCRVWTASSVSGSVGLSVLNGCLNGICSMVLVLVRRLLAARPPLRFVIGGWSFFLVVFMNIRGKFATG